MCTHLHCWCHYVQLPSDRCWWVTCVYISARCQDPEPSPSLQTWAAWVLLTSKPVRPAEGAGRDSGIPGMQHSWCYVCITRTLSSLPEILHLYRWIYVRVESQNQLLFETSRDAKKQQPFSVYHCLFLIWGEVFCPPNTGEPKGIPESWGDHANSTVKTWDGIKARTSVLSLIKCRHSP